MLIKGKNLWSYDIEKTYENTTTSIPRSPMNQALVIITNLRNNSKNAIATLLEVSVTLLNILLARIKKQIAPIKTATDKASGAISGVGLMENSIKSSPFSQIYLRHFHLSFFFYS